MAKAKAKVDAPKKGPGRPAIQPRDDHARMAQTMSQYGVPQEDIASALGMSVETMIKLYGEEMRKGKAFAKANIGRRLYEKAVNEGDTTALIFLGKTQLGMREVNRTEVTSPDGSMSPTQDITVTFVDPEQVKKGK